MARFNNRSIARIAVSFSAAALVALGSALPSFATTDVVLTGGSAASGGGTTFVNFTGITLNGFAQKTDAAWPIANIVDATGAHAGWHLSYTMSALTAGGVNLAATVKTSPLVAQVDSTSSPASTVVPVAAGTALDTGAPVSILTAAAGADSGMGSFSFTGFVATVAVPANAPAATYTSSVTLSLTTP